MLPVLNETDTAKKLNPWIQSLVGEDTADVWRTIRNRLPTEFESIQPLVESFHPLKIEYEDDDGYVLLMRNTPEFVTTTSYIYIQEPLSVASLNSMIEYFEMPVRNLIRGFYSLFAGFGTAKRGRVGRFLHAAVFAKRRIGPTLSTEWLDARLLFTADNGDSLLINKQGETAWHVLGEDDVFPLFKDFIDFPRHYITFIANEEDIFDCWSSLSFRDRGKSKS
jgi:hypothetical protein